MTVEPNRDQQHLPGPSLWPIGFAIGAACFLLGLVLSWYVAAVGAAIAVICAAFWIRDSTRGYATPAEVEPETRPARTASVATEPVAGPAPVDGGDPERYSRSVFLEGTTLGLGAVIGGLVAVPALGFMVAPAFVATVNLDSPTLVIRRLTDPPPADQQYVLWAVPAKGDVQSLGVLDQPRNSFPFDMTGDVVLEVSREPKATAVPAAPSGPIVFQGKLVAGN